MNEKSLETIISMLKKGKEKESKYNCFYKYFCAALKKLKIQSMIDYTIISRLTLRKKFALEELNDNDLDYSLPEDLNEEEKRKERKTVERIINKIRSNSYDEYETIKQIETPSEFEELEKIIYERIIEELGTKNNEKKDNTDLKNYCLKLLEGITIKGKSLIVDGKIDEKVYNEILNVVLDASTISKIEMLIELRDEKIKAYYEIQKSLKQIENLTKILEELTREVIGQELKEIDKEFLKTILKEEYLYEHADLIHYGHVEEDAICMGETLPKYVESFPEEIKNPLQYRCKLQGIFNSISNRRSDSSVVLKYLSDDEKQELKSRIKEFLKQTNNKKLDDYIKSLLFSIEDYISKITEKIIRLRKQIEEVIEPKERSIRSKKLDRLKSLYDIGTAYELTPFEAIFMYKLLIDIENMENIDSYRNLVYIVLSDEIKMFDDGTRIAVKSIIDDTYDEYFYNTKKSIKN